MGRLVRALVTGAGGGGHGEQILKALRLAATSYDITATDVSPHCAGAALSDHFSVLPHATDTDYVPRLLALCQSRGIDVLFHGSEPELKQLSKERTRFAEVGVLVPMNPAALIETCMDKVQTMEMLGTLGFSVPAYRKIKSVAEANEFDHLPAVLKPSIGGGGSMHVYLVQRKEELMVCATQLLQAFEEFIIQEYVGRPEDEYTVGVLLDLDGNLINSIALRRDLASALSHRLKVPNRSGRPEIGPILAISSGVSQGAIGRFGPVTTQCESIATAIGARGPINIQCRLVDGQVLVFEINPRFSGTTSLRAMVGYNEPDVLVRKHLLGETIEKHFPYGEGVIVRSLAETLFETAPGWRG